MAAGNAAGLAQLVEQPPCKRQVGGSIPLPGTKTVSNEVKSDEAVLYMLRLADWMLSPIPAVQLFMAHTVD